MPGRCGRVSWYLFHYGSPVPLWFSAGGALRANGPPHPSLGHSAATPQVTTPASSQGLKARFIPRRLVPSIMVGDPTHKNLETSSKRRGSICCPAAGRGRVTVDGSLWCGSNLPESKRDSGIDEGSMPIRTRFARADDSASSGGTPTEPPSECRQVGVPAAWAGIGGVCGVNAVADRLPPGPSIPRERGTPAHRLAEGRGRFTRRRRSAEPLRQPVAVPGGALRDGGQAMCGLRGWPASGRRFLPVLGTSAADTRCRVDLPCCFRYAGQRPRPVSSFPWRAPPPVPL